MTNATRPKLTRSLRLGLLIAAIIGLVTGLFAWHQVDSERKIDLEDVTRRAHVLAQQLSERASYALTQPDAQARQAEAAERARAPSNNFRRAMSACMQGRGYQVE